MRGLLGGQAFGEIVLRVKIRTGKGAVQRHKKAGPTRKLECVSPEEQRALKSFPFPASGQLLPPLQHHFQDHRSLPPLPSSSQRSAFAPFQSVVFWIVYSTFPYIAIIYRSVLRYLEEISS